jgi:hypothetical protein
MEMKSFDTLGGYALVFIAYDVKTNKEYALKVNRTDSVKMLNTVDCSFRDCSLPMTVQKKLSLRKSPSW